MGMLNWFEPLAGSTTLEQVGKQWAGLLASEPVNAGYEDPRMTDALIAFLARAALPANLRLAAVLAFTSKFDLSPRLALAAVEEELQEEPDGWPAVITDAASIAGSCVAVPSTDPWMRAYLTGRITGLRDADRHVDWPKCFWNHYLELSCRWADLTGVRHALKRGADPRYDEFTAIRAAARGTQAEGGDAYYVVGRNHSEYCQLVDLLLCACPQDSAPGAAAVLAAAEADNEDMLSFLAGRGIDVHVDNEAALVAAAGSFALAALEWLLHRGANVHARGEAALVAAVGALDSAAVETLLDAGADIHANDELPVRTAFSANPFDLYNGEVDFIFHRADMIMLLQSRGARLDQRTVSMALEGVADGPRVIQVLKSHGADLGGFADTWG